MISIRHHYEHQDIIVFRITNTSGAYCEISNYGATLISIVVPDRKGIMGNVILGYNEISDYLTDKFYLGSTIGRVANRIRNAGFSLNGNNITLDKNDGENNLHGGFNGINTKVLDFEIVNSAVIFKGKSILGEGGFPGNIQFTIKYSFNDTNELLIEYVVTADTTTPVNFTNHAYFKLNPELEDILTHELQINSETCLEMDSKLLPTGNIQKVKNSEFDFLGFQSIESKRSAKDGLFPGYNVFYIADDNGRSDFNFLATARENTSGRLVELHTTMPGVMFYTGDFLSGVHKPCSGLCLEAQYHPDFMNHKHFPQSWAGPGADFNEKIKFVFKTY
jgi:aldose 1-epimerase